jgi:hypothetical protein
MGEVCAALRTEIEKDGDVDVDAGIMDASHKSLQSLEFKK